MAYQTGSATDQTDLMDDLQTFVAANGFTVDNYDGPNRFLSISRAADDLYVTFYWDGTSHMALFQALGYNGAYAQQPWNQADDSGNGNSTLANIYSGRNINNIGAGPFTAYHFFAYTNPYAIHVVLEFSPGLYRHFGFGMISKHGTWTGGAWAGGHHWNPQDSYGQYDAPNGTPHTILTDAGYYPNGSKYNWNQNAGATLHVEGLPDQPSGGKWGHCCSAGTTDALVGNDRGGTGRIRISANIRNGIAVRQFGWMLPDLQNGFVPIIPNHMFYIDGDAGSGSQNWYYLGKMPNVGMVHLEGIDPDQEITVGGDTWMAFPGVRKSKILNNNQESWNMGIIYKKVT